MNKAQRIGILGGTFDPVHLGHIGIANAVVDKLDLDTCLLMPCKVPVHKDNPTTTPKQRQHMLILATQDQPKLQVDTRELERLTPSYTVETAQSLRHSQPEATLCWILGTDAFAAFTGWHQWPEILKFVNLVVVPRDGKHNQPKPDERLFGYVTPLEQLCNQPHGGIGFYDDCPKFPYSSTSIRAQLPKHLSRQPLPAAVKDYIRGNASL